MSQRTEVRGLRRHYRPGTLRGCHQGRQEGIALMVVMVVFIVLYLVVFQLHYTTRLEEKLSKARAADAQGAAAIRSVAFSVLALLAEDYATGAQGQSAGASGQIPSVTGAGSDTQRDESKKKTAAPAESSSGDAPAEMGAGGAGAAGYYDHLGEVVFADNEQNLNNVSVKVTITDSERAIDLNQLWSYAPALDETVSEAQQVAQESGSAESIVASMVNDAKSGQKKEQTKSKSSKTSRAGLPSATAGGAGAAATEEGVVLGWEVGASLAWEPPSEERRQDAVEFLDRVIDAMYRYNIDYGFDYVIMPPASRLLAESIERYVYDRRSQPNQNFIHLPSELMNVLASLGVGPEVYYGPVPRLAAGEEFFDATQSFSYTKDNYGDLVGEFLGAEDVMAEREMMQEELKQLQGIFGQFESFPGLGRMGNPLTRNSKEYSEVMDEAGNVMIAVPPMPLGLRDIFTTFSTTEPKKINLNTAPYPILYALQRLVIETEPGGKEKAERIAKWIVSYREKYQQELDETDPTSAEKKTSLKGAPTRAPKDEKKEGASKKDLASLLGSSGAAATAGLSAETLAAATEGGGGNYDTNYFTSLDQLLLIDDGEKDELLTPAATQSADLENLNVYQKVEHDFKQVVDFHSSFFTATLKSKADDSPAICTGYLTVFRNIPKKRMEVVQWKELQW